MIESALDIHRDRPDRFVLDGPAVMVGSRAGAFAVVDAARAGDQRAKYGALSNADGRVTIAWAIDGDGTKASVTLRWIEAGGPTVVAPKRTGFGPG